MIVVTDKAIDTTLYPIPKSKSWLTPERHYGYAVQWYSLAGLLMILSVISLRKLRTS